MPGPWHRAWQNKHQAAGDEVERPFKNDFVRRSADVYVASQNAVLEYQHSPITNEEVQGRNADYATFSEVTAVAWIIDCTGSNYVRVGADKWLLTFEKHWQVHAMRRCEMLFADFGQQIFRVPCGSIRHRMVLVCGATNAVDWVDAVHHGRLKLEKDVPRPLLQSSVTLATNAAGSGKTYSVVRMIVAPDGGESKHSMYIVVTKWHSAKEVAFSEFMRQMAQTRVQFEKEPSTGRKHVVTFTRPSGQRILVIFGTVDSLFWNLCENRICGADYYMSLVKTLETYGPTKVHGPYGAFSYAGERPCLNGRTLIVTDEATLLPEAYADGFAALMDTGSVDVYLAGDPQQSTLVENNMLTRVLREYRAADVPGLPLPTFPTSEMTLLQGNVVRRFDERGVHFRNTIMRDFHENPTHNLDIPQPIAATDVRHAPFDFSFHKIPATRCSRSDRDGSGGGGSSGSSGGGGRSRGSGGGSSRGRGSGGSGGGDDDDGDDDDDDKYEDGADDDDAVDVVMGQLERDVLFYRLLPTDVLVVTLFVTKNPLMDALQTAMHNWWSERLLNEGSATYQAYRTMVMTTHPGEAADAVAARVKTYEAIQASAGSSVEHGQTLPWLAVLHRSEENKPIDTSESTHGVRMVSVHASQGDARRAVFLVGLSERGLKRFTGQQINLKYESMVNVAVTRARQVCRVFLEDKHDDIWRRCAPLLPDDVNGGAPNPRISLTLDLMQVAAQREMPPDVFLAAKAAVEQARATAAEKKGRAATSTDLTAAATPAVDYAHHLVRYAVVKTVFYVRLGVQQAAAPPYEKWEQMRTLLNKIAKAPIRSVEQTAYFRVLRDSSSRDIPLLSYDDGSHRFGEVHAHCRAALEEVKENARQWVGNQSSAFLQTMTPLQALMLQFAVERFQLAPYNRAIVKADHLCDVARADLDDDDDDDDGLGSNKLTRHYGHVRHASSVFDELTGYFSESLPWSCLVYRMIYVGKPNGMDTRFVRLRFAFDFLFVSATTATPVIFCKSINDVTMASVCAQGLLATLACMQPADVKTKQFKGKTVAERVRNKRIVVCVVPMEASDGAPSPLFVDFQSVWTDAELRKSVALWLRECVEDEMKKHVEELLAVAAYYDYESEGVLECLHDHAIDGAFDVSRILDGMIMNADARDPEDNATHFKAAMQETVRMKCDWFQRDLCDRKRLEAHDRADGSVDKKQKPLTKPATSATSASTTSAATT